MADLLVIVDNGSIIVSDKAGTYPPTSDEQRNWGRYFRNHIREGAQQAWEGTTLDRDVPRPRSRVQRYD